MKKKKSKEYEVILKKLPVFLDGKLEVHDN